MSGPYGAAHAAYLEVGWRGLLPIPAGTKGPPPEGWTGGTGGWPTPDQVRAWAANGHAGDNIAVRVPGDIVGIDVDQYGTKAGADAVRDLARRTRAAGIDLPGLPSTWRSSSRPHPSGIYWFRCPPGTKFDGAPLPGVEMIQRHHRYAIVWPSIHRDTGARYEWFTPNGEMADHPPGPDDLPDLPSEWATLLSSRQAPEMPASNPPAGVHREAQWSEGVIRAHTRAVDALGAGGSRHDAAVAGSCALARLESLGNPGSTAALEDLGARFVAAVTSAGTGQRRDDEARREWAQMLDGGRLRVQTTAATTGPYVALDAFDAFMAEGPTTAGEPGPAVTPGPPVAPSAAAVLPEEFWAARPVLTHIRQAAHSRNRSADLVLHAVLARMSAYSAHTFELPPIVGAPGSLNYFVAATGPSGSGKSSGVAIAGELVTPTPLLDVADNMPLGSGEGLAELYMGVVEVEGQDGKKTKVREQVRYNAFVYGDEGQTLTAMMQRSGVTLPAALRNAWSGAELGQANASAERTRVLHAGQYRLGLVIGFQPEVAGQLLGDANAGTPQRFTWASAIDPHVPDTAPPWPGRLEVRGPSVPQLEARRITTSGGYVRHRFAVDPAIAAEVRADDLARVRGLAVVDELDSHRPLHLLKLSALLALLDGRLDVTPDDWELAHTMWATSCSVRAGVVAAVAAEHERIEGGRVDQLARRELVAEAARRSAPAAVERIAKRLAVYVHNRVGEVGAEDDDGVALRDLRHRLASKERHMLDPALSHALEHEWITEVGGRFLPGSSRPA